MHNASASVGEAGTLAAGVAHPAGPVGATARVGATILNYHSTTDTLAAVASLLNGDYLDLAVTVVDNGEPAECDPELAAKLPPRVRYLPAGANLGYAAGNNLAIAEFLSAGLDYVLIMNPDARLEPGTLSGLLAASRKVPSAGFIGPRLLDGELPGRVIQSDGGRIDWARAGAPIHLNVGKPADTIADTLTEVDYVTGACVLVNRRALDEVGLIPEDYFLYFEETDLAVRAARRGWKSLVARSVVAHHHRRSVSEVPSRAYLYYLTRNRGLFASRFLDGGDPVQRAYADFDKHFLGPWRKRIERDRPDMLESFDAVVALAKRDAYAGVSGPSAELLNHHKQGVPGWSQ
jgi:GT2 family glycosyltransferase